MSCIYDYCAFYLGPKTTNNFFSRTIFKLIKKVYIFEEIEYWILTVRIAVYRTFISSPKYPPMYTKEEAILEGCQEPSYLVYYFEKVKEWYRNKNKNDEIATI